MRLNRRRMGKVWLSVAAVLVIGGGLTALWLFRGQGSQAHAQSGDADHHQQEAPEVPSVKVVKALSGGVERTTTQPGTVRAFNSQQVRARVSGVLKNQKVDRGTAVKKNEVVAEIDAPELVADRDRAAAEVKVAEAKIAQAEANLETASKDLVTAQKFIPQREAEFHRAVANLHYRDLAYKRVNELVRYKSVDQRLVDEQFEQFQAAQAWKVAATAGVDTAKADVDTKQAKVKQAQADIEAAKANRKLAEANLDKAEKFVEFTKVRSGYDGVVTVRNFDDGDFINAADRGQQPPLLVIQRQDLMRLIIQVPDSDAPQCDDGDPVDFRISTMPDAKFKGLKIARISDSQDQKSRTMWVEVDIPNPKLANGKRLLRDGLYGEATIHLQAPRKDAVRVPTATLRRSDKQASVFVVREGVVHQVAVTVGADDGHQAEITAGLRAGDQVVYQPGPQLRDGVAVRVTPLEGGQRTASAH